MRLMTEKKNSLSLYFGTRITEELRQKKQQQRHFFFTFEAKLQNRRIRSCRVVQEKAPSEKCVCDAALFGLAMRDERAAG